MAIVYIGLGSNMRDRDKNLQKAIKHLDDTQNISVIKESTVKETDPVDYLHQSRFLNQIICIETSLEPHVLLLILKDIESSMGRKQIIPKGPRIIDIDILLYDDIIISTDNLKIPHPEIKNRIFILEHLLELDPDLIDPETKRVYSEFIT